MIVIQKSSRKKTALFTMSYPVEYERPADIYNGKKITLRCEADDVAITHNGNIVAIYQREDAAVFRCVRGLW